MEFEEQDTDVITLLTKLKESEENYPVDLMTSCRRGYIKQIAALSMGASTSAALKAGSAAFINRHKVLNLNRTVSGLPVVEQISIAQHPSSAVPLVALALIDTVKPTAVVTETSAAVVTTLPEMLFVIVTDLNRNRQLSKK